MLADYPAIVDYNFSPVQSPLFHRDVGADEDLFIPGHYEVDEIDIPIADTGGFSGDHPLLFNEEEDSLSSISATIQNSAQIECTNDHIESLKEGASYQSEIIHDSSIADGGVEGLSGNEGLFGSVGSDCLNSNYLSSLQLHESENVPLDLLDSIEDDLDLYMNNTSTLSDPNSTRPKVTSQGCALSSSGTSSTLHSTKKSKKKLEDKRWVEMTVEEKEDVAEHLSVMLRSLLGPRERIEVMAMITQQKRPRLTDTDFVIESHMLNESILAKLERFLEENEVKGEASDSELVVEEPKRKRSHGNAGRRKCASLPASPQHGGSFVESPTSIGSKKRSGQRRAWRRRTRKEYRQASKERRSGLFEQEEVIALRKGVQEEEIEEEEEIDILE